MERDWQHPPGSYGLNGEHFRYFWNGKGEMTTMRISEPGQSEKIFRLGQPARLDGRSGLVVALRYGSIDRPEDPENPRHTNRVVKIWLLNHPAPYWVSWRRLKRTGGYL